jgi:hypothetical protein
MRPSRAVHPEVRFHARNPKGRSNVYAGSNSAFRRRKGDFRMLVSALVTFLVVILILYLINLLPIDGRAKQIARVVVIILGVISLLKYIAVF